MPARLSESSSQLASGIPRGQGSANPDPPSLPPSPSRHSTTSASMISPRLTLSPSFLAFRPGSQAASPPPSPRLHAPPPLSASAAVTAPDHAAASGSSFYDVLGLRPGASQREIKAAYRRLALAVHPDAAPHPASSSSAAAAAEDFIRVHAAYSTLSDPDKRADYDLRLLLSAGHRRAQPLTLGRSSTSPRRSRRTWETDQCW